MATFRLVPQGPYSLAAAARFLCGFTPASGAACARADGGLTIGFLSDDRHEPVVVSLAARDGHVEGAVEGAVDEASVARQVARILSLDHDARGFAGVGERDPIIAALLGRAPGFRPVCFPSPYEAAVWGVLAQRTTMAGAATLKRRLARATGTRAEGFGQVFEPAPAPGRLLALTELPGLPEEKLRRLHAVARAAMDGTLDAGRLRALPRAAALAELRQLRGVGDWTAEHILLRGAGVQDELPTMEPRVLRGVSEAYGLPATASLAELARLAERWRPYRMWVCVLLVTELAQSARWHGPEPRGSRRPGPPALARPGTPRIVRTPGAPEHTLPRTATP